jgi:hypothetical protein
MFPGGEVPTMKRIRVLASASLAILVTVSAPARAERAGGAEPPLAAPFENAPDELKSAARQAAEAFAAMIGAAQELAKQLPRYGAPRFDENGDIVIPRRDPPPTERKPLPPDQLGT